MVNSEKLPSIQTIFLWLTPGIEYWLGSKKIAKIAWHQLFGKKGLAAKVLMAPGLPDFFRSLWPKSW